jgi:hypothetical protein
MTKIWISYQGCIVAPLPGCVVSKYLQIERIIQVYLSKTTTAPQFLFYSICKLVMGLVFEVLGLGPTKDRK